ncbi:MAG: hypothetical protein HKM05_03285 [Spirochaetales bacterium]|nr:hypothetical protein [Spirochaetales bacterium]
MALKLRSKMLAGFIGVALIGTAIGAVGIFGITNVNNADRKLFQQITVPLSQLVEVTKNFELLRIANIKYVESANLAEAAPYESQINASEAELKKVTDEYRATLYTDKGKQIVGAFDSAVASYETDINQVLSLVKAGKHDAAIAVVNGSAAVNASKAGQALDAMTAEKIMVAKGTSDGNTALTNSMVTLMLAIILLGFIVSIGIALWIGVWMISRPLLSISKTLGGGAGQIGVASEQLSSSSQEIANGATEQASSIEETTASMEELSSMVKQNLVNAKESSTLADKSAQLGQDGAGQMGKMLEAMSEISRSSSEVGKVIKVIDDIAFQTNILALNAAVEAARAGEAGMGFAVVADEVKNLANRSAAAAKETAEMIEGSIRKSQVGLDIATKLGELFQEIVGVGKKVSEMAREVESASRQQDTGIEQVNKAIVQFDEVVQANASSAEETASAAQELQSQVSSLNEIVAQLSRLVSGIETHETTFERPQHTSEAKSGTHATHSATSTTHKSSAAQLSLPHHASRPGKTREVNPEQLIPFEDDEDLK